jgi:DNA repair protein RadC
MEQAQVRIKLSSSREVFHLMKPIMEDLQIEQFWVLYLNNASSIIDKQRISEGGMTATIVDVRLIFKHALRANATAIILCHNHPSGSLVPSKADQNITDKIVKAARYMDVQVLDHLIITEQSYFSFADEARI